MDSSDGRPAGGSESSAGARIALRRFRRPEGRPVPLRDWTPSAAPPLYAFADRDTVPFEVGYLVVLDGMIL
jgi:hypothetical protein